MDTKEIVNVARARFNRQQSITQLYAKYNARLVRAHAGGLWRITPELIGYLKSAPPKAVLLDTFKTPIEIDTSEFLQFIEPIYTTVMSEWLAEYQKLNTLR